MNRVDISVMELNVPIEEIVQELVQNSQCVQCRDEKNILIMSEAGKAVFDLSGNLLELYDYKKDPRCNIANESTSGEFEFEMVLLFSKFNM